MALWGPLQENSLRSFDFSSWASVLTTLVGIALFALVGIGIRLVMMTTIQQRQQRQNRQINERLKTLIAAYKVLGGSFTGELLVDPTHRRELRQRAQEAGAEDAAGSDRARRIRDAVEAALSDIILLGTEEQVRLAAKAAQDMVDGRPVRLAALVHSLRTFIRSALYLEDIPADVRVPDQGPVRPGSGPGGGGRMGAGAGNARGGGGGGGGGGAGGAAAGGGAGMGMGMAMGGREDR